MTDALNDRPIRVLVVDDHQIMRDGLQQVLEASGEFKVVGHAGDGPTAVSMAGNLRPEVIIMDVMMPGMSGVDACREIMGALPETKVIILTAASAEDAAIDALAAGAKGYLEKYSGKEHLLAAVREVASGEYRVPPDVLQRVFAEIRSEPKAGERSGYDRLTLREREILELFAKGSSYAEIAQKRGNRPLTIRNAVYSIRDKLGVQSMQGLVVWAVRNGLLDDDSDEE